MTSKKDLSERGICTKYIQPALEKAGWNPLSQIRKEVSFTDGTNRTARYDQRIALNRTVEAMAKRGKLIHKLKEELEA